MNYCFLPTNNSHILVESSQSLHSFFTVSNKVGHIPKFVGDRNHFVVSSQTSCTWR